MANKQTLVGKVVEVTGVSKKDAEQYVNAVLDAIVEATDEAGKLSIVGFGIFEAKEREARESTNPQDPTGAKIQVPAKRVPTFKAGKGFKDAVAYK